MEFDLCQKNLIRPYISFMEPIYDNLREVAEKHDSLVRIGLLGVGILDTIATITLVAIRTMESLIVIMINILGAPISDRCSLIDAKEAGGIALYFLRTPVIPFIAIKNIISLKDARVIFRW